MGILARAGLDIPPPMTSTSSAKIDLRTGLWLEDVPEPEFGINDVKIRILLTGICCTDLHIYEWDERALAALHVRLSGVL